MSEFPGRWILMINLNDEEATNKDAASYETSTPWAHCRDSLQEDQLLDIG